MRSTALPTRTIPATVLSGFLGAGKTTFLNYILQEQTDLRVAVIINEIGAVNIDHHLIQMQDESVLEMSNGCVCCTIRADLLQGILNLLHRAPFDYLVIEPTGLADPGPIAQTFLNVAELQPYVKLDSIMTLVDALNFFDQCRASEVTQSQVEMADFLILNKVDLASPEQIRKVTKRLRTLNPHASIHPTSRGRIDLSQVWDAHAFNFDQKVMMRPDLLLNTSPHRHQEKIEAVSLTYDTPFILEKFEAFLGRLSSDFHILRAKGLLHFQRSERRGLFHGVNDRYSLYWDKTWESEEARRSELVFIGERVPREEIERGLEKCLAG